MPTVDLTVEEIERILANSRVTYWHCVDLVIGGQMPPPAWSELDNTIHQKLSNALRDHE